MSNGAPPPNPALEAYKLEYQLAAGRYENIYKAIWQIFSYLSAVAAAILTFGGDHFQQNLLWALAALPLFFWYLSTFLPMNRYGDLCLTRLADTETAINGLIAPATIMHYTDFRNNRSKGIRVRGTVHVLCIALGLFFIVNGYLTFQAWCGHEPLIMKKSADKPISLTVDELKKLMEGPSSTVQKPEETKPSDVKK